VKMDELLKFLIRKKASVVYMAPNTEYGKIIRMIVEQTSKQKAVVSRIIGNDIKEAFSDRIFQTTKPGYGDYCIGDAGCGLYIKQSVNHCILLNGQFVDMNMFDVTAVFDDNYNLKEILYNDEKISRNYIPEKLAAHLAEITKTTPKCIMRQFLSPENEILQGPVSNEEEFIACLAKSGVSITFKTEDGSKAAENIMCYIRDLKASILLIEKNDKSRFKGKDLPVITDFYAQRLIKGQEEREEKIVIPLFNIKRYKNVPKSSRFIYVGFSDNDKTVPNSKAVITLSDKKPVKLVSEETEMNFADGNISFTGDFNSFIEKNKIILSRGLLNLLKVPS